MAGQENPEAVRKLLENLQSDLKNISLETKKKYPSVKESAEEAIVKIRNASGSNTPLVYLSNQILYPLVQGCETKDTKVVNLCLQVIQRLITCQVLDGKGAKYVVETMWMLMEAGIEEVRLLQTLTLLVTTNTVCCGDVLARCLVICFRLSFSKDNTIAATGGATVRHLATAVFDRALTAPASKTTSVKDLAGPVSDAYLLFQDLVQLVNADQPLWLVGIVEMTRTFGLELLETLLLGYSPLFYNHDQCRMLLKERVCSLVIKLFSPNIKYRGGSGSPGHSPAAFDKPYYSISLRLLRVVSVLVEKYYKLLITECEIFLSLIVKFLDPDKPSWQRALALELLHKLVIQPRLLTDFCRYYDCQPHATNIFQDMINSLGAYVQNMFISLPGAHHQQETQSSQSQPQSSSQPGMIAGLPVGPGVSAQPGFYYRGVYQPLTLSWLGGTAKCQYLDMTDRMEPPVMQEGYGVSLAYGCLLDVVRSISLVMDTEEKDTDTGAPVSLTQVRSQLLTSSWCGLLSAMALLLDAATEDSTAENILKCLCVYSSLAARLDMQLLRDSYITAVCKASLPPHYTLSVLKATPSTQLVSGKHGADGDHGHGDLSDYRHQVVAVGTPLATASLPPSAQQGPVMLTAKNIQCMRSILSIAHCHGDLLGAAWHIVLTTLQHLVWILGLKPSSGQGGQLRAGRSSTETSAVLTTAVMADLPVLANMLTTLFEATSSNLGDSSLSCLIEALISINSESLSLAMNNREPSLFAVAKLLETGIVNMARVESWWVKVTSHLLEACSHPHTKMREWSAEAVCVLIQASLRHEYPQPLANSPKLQTLLMTPLVELSPIPHPDIRARQLDCVMTILHSSAEQLSMGWPLLITVIGSLRPQHTEALVKTAFQALQLVLTDFLPLAPHNCLPLAVHTAAKFGSQTQDLNISLTAVGLLWNLSDYFYQNQDSLKTAIIAEPKILPDLPGYKEMSVFDKLWMCLFSRLGDLCLDPRPATRKSAGQTLFSTIAAHGSLLAVSTWQAVLWQVLFPLLDKVGIESGLASNERSDNGGTLLIHHSRNTEHKQWSETQVLTISGVARVFVTKRSLLHTLGDFPKAWRLLLEHVEKLALSPTQEVSIAALKAFQEMVVGAGEGEEGEEETARWAVAWRTWLAIGHKVTANSQSHDEDCSSPTQAFLTALYHIFPLLHPHIKTKLTASDVTKLCEVTQSCLGMPVQADSELGFLLTVNDGSLLPLHSSIIKCITAIETHALAANPCLVPPLFTTYLQLCTLVHTWPQGAHQCAVKGMFPEKYILLGERALINISRLFEKTHSYPCVLDNLLLLNIVDAIKTPLVMKYKCIKQTSWKIAIEVLISILTASISDIKDRDKYAEVWTMVTKTLDEFLFPTVKLPNDISPSQLAEDESIDCSVIEFLRTQVLERPSLFPHNFIKDIMIILNKGSIHSHYNGQDHNRNQDALGAVNMREDFAKICFETLLQYSLLEKETNSKPSVAVNGNGMTVMEDTREMMDNVTITEEDVTNKLAVMSLLHRFEDVMTKYIQDEKLSSPVPLPSHRVAELSFVLKALTTLISSLKKGQSEVDAKTWEQVISLFPHLVQATSIKENNVNTRLQEALHQYKDLLQPPRTKNN